METNVLEKIKDKLTSLCSLEAAPMEGVWYGLCTVKDLDKWNYFVFNRRKTTKSTNRCDLETYYDVHIVQENYIPPGYVEMVIEALKSIEGCRLQQTADDVTYDYVMKGNTEMIVEIATITFVRPEKRC